MPSCCVKNCTNYDTKCNKISDGISYHRFPTDPVRNESWCRVIRLQRDEPFFKSNKFLRVCTSHFATEDFLTTKSGLRRLIKTAIPRLTVSISQDKQNDIPTQISRQDTPDQELIDVDISDLQSIFDSPRKVKLEKKIKTIEQRHIANVKKIKNLQKMNSRLKKRNESLTNILKMLEKKKYITEDIASALQIKSEVAEIYRLQILKNQNKRGNKRPSYPLVLRKFALTLNFCSPAAYKYIRRKFNCCLPHPRTLAKWYSSINGEPGFTQEAFDVKYT